MVNIPVIYRVLYIQTVVGNGISEPSTVLRTWERGIFYVAHLPIFLSYSLIVILRRIPVQIARKATWKQLNAAAPPGNSRKVTHPGSLVSSKILYISKKNKINKQIQFHFEKKC